MEHREEAGVEINFFTAINRGEWQAHGLTGHVTHAQTGGGFTLSQLSPPQDPVLLAYSITRHEREDINVVKLISSSGVSFLMKANSVNSKGSINSVEGKGEIAFFEQWRRILPVSVLFLIRNCVITL